jgi:hypothetical protein
MPNLAYFKRFILVSLLAMTWSCPAAGILGELWQNDSAATNASIVPTGVADAEFYSSGIDYDTRLSGYTPAQFFNNPSFFNTSAGFNPAGSLDNTYVRFTGQLFLNSGVNTFSVPHDDGAILSIAGIGTVLSQPGPTSAVTNTFNVTAPSSGLYNFTLEYGECAGPPAVLRFDVNGTIVGVPEPSSFLLCSAGLVVTLLATRRRL